LNWNPAWPELRPLGYVLTGVSIAGAIAATFFMPYPEREHWGGGVWFDNEARRLLRARDPDVRDAIRVASDVTLLTNVLQTSVLDGLVLPLLDDNPRLATQLSLINAQTFSFNILVATVLFKLVARERPLIEDCRHDVQFDPLCTIGQYASFPSSHASTAFTAAGLTCVTHANLPLYGGGAWDTAACIQSLVFAAATGLFRIIGDRHYATDVLMGAALGLTIGYMLPWLFHYQYGPAVPEHRIDTSSANMSRAPVGFSIGGFID